jgi:hypothetical protein
VRAVNCSTPGVLAPVRVIVSRSIITYSTPSAPLAGTARLHRKAAYTHCPRCAPNSRAPRRPTRGSVLSLAYFLDMSPSETPGSSSVASVQFLHRRRWPSTACEVLGASDPSHPPILVRERNFEASLRFTFAATCRFARPPVGADQAFAQPTRTFTSGLSADWSPAPPPDITTVATGQAPPAGLSPASNAN